MCRQELATRENMLDHDQFSPSAKGYVHPRPAPYSSDPPRDTDLIAEEVESELQSVSGIRMDTEEGATTLAPPEGHPPTSLPTPQGPPAIANPECSGYFVQPTPILMVKSRVDAMDGPLPQRW
ncbi:hypothetical protein HWV62_37659 [Athelia sp. TMB]|nr:hypothetical protein HWV62_37659 [Athelia sp. TMB]